MATSKSQVGRLLSDNGSIQVYELETDIGSLAGSFVVPFDETVAAFSETAVAVRVTHGMYGDQPQVAQVILSRDVFLSLIASYRAFERAEKKRPAPAPDDYDPFLDDDK